MPRRKAQDHLVEKAKKKVTISRQKPLNTHDERNIPPLLHRWNGTDVVVQETTRDE
jgi:hypothetical protein